MIETFAVGISGTAHSSKLLAKELAVGGMGLRTKRSSSVLEREREGSRKRERGRERSSRAIM